MKRLKPVRGRSQNGAGPPDGDGALAKNAPSPSPLNSKGIFPSSGPSAIGKKSDAEIPGILRGLECDQREWQHDGLGAAITAAEWFLIDLIVWQAYPPEFARAECWRHIKVAFAWVRHLRRGRAK
jgi:hypothetical protein